MGVGGIDLAIVLAYLAIVLVVGFFLGRKETAEGFFVNERKTKLFLLIFTALSTSIGSGTVIGVASAGYESGVSFGLSFAILSLISWSFMAWIAPRIKAWGDKIGAYTFNDFLAARYSSATRNVGIVVVLTAYFTITAVQFVAFASLAAVIGGVSFEWALTGAALVTITYTLLAGIKGDFYTDAIQFFVMLPVFFLLTYLGLSRIGLSELLAQVPPEFLSPTNYAGTTFFIAAIVFGFSILLVSVEVWQRIFAAADAHTVRVAFMWSGLLKVSAIVFAMLFGLMAFQLVPGVEKDTALFALMIELLPAGVLGVGFASILAILMSTVDSMLMVGSATLTKDWFLARRPGADERTKLRMGRWFVLLFGVGAFLVALLVQDIVRLAVTSVQILSVFMPALLGGLLWKRASAPAAFWSILVGFLVTIVLLTFIPDIAAVPALLVSIVLFVGLTYWRPRSAELVTT
jgi:SSS family solute:Na+ symporter